MSKNTRNLHSQGIAKQLANIRGAVRCGTARHGAARRGTATAPTLRPSQFMKGVDEPRRYERFHPPHALQVRRRLDALQRRDGRPLAKVALQLDQPVAHALVKVAQLERWQRGGQERKGDSAFVLLGTGRKAVFEGERVVEESWEGLLFCSTHVPCTQQRYV